MKKHVLCLMLALLLLLTGCSLLTPKNEPDAISSYPKDEAPSQIVKTESHWIMRISTYEGRDHSISVSDTYDTVNSVYSVKDVSIWYMAANENAVVWCEKNNDFYTYKTYVFSTESVETIFKVSAEAGYQPQNVGAFLGFAYWCNIDYQNKEVNVLAYDFETKTTKTVKTEAFKEDNQPYSINLDNEYLSFVCTEQIKVFNLNNDETVYEASLPADVKHVFAASYDSVYDTCALYYSDADSEDIGVLEDDGAKIYSVFTFNENHYAYRDTIKCHNGRIYWIAQANVSGWVSDHYTLIDYNYRDHKVTETERAFAFCLDSEAVFSLRFNKKGEYTDIELCKH